MSNEFVFGSLSTEYGRVIRARTVRYGFYHDSILEPNDPGPDAPVTIKAYAGPGATLKSAELSFTTDGSLPKLTPEISDTSTHRIPMLRTEIKWDTLHWGFIEEWSAVIPGQILGTRVRYIIKALTNTDQPIFSPFFDPDLPEIREKPHLFDLKFIEKLTRNKGPQIYQFDVDDARVSDWLRQAVVYQIFVDRFAANPGRDLIDPGDRAGFYGGTLEGILSKLDYLRSLGVNCIWLSPIFPSPSHHGYDSTDYENVEPRLGTLDGLNRLVQAAHQVGIRIILDFVANHVSKDHPAFIAAQTNPGSPTRSWFYYREYPNDYECYFDVPDLPIINTDFQEVRDYLIHSATYWLQQGVDGFRLDHAHGASHAFWSEFRSATRAVMPDSATFGEVTDTPAVMRSYCGRMDGCLDFELLDLLRSFFAFRKITPSQFDRALHKHFAYFDGDMVLLSFLDNHDMNRFLWVVRGDTRRLRLAALCQFTLPGPPIIYYGTEVGLSQLMEVGRLEEARLPMPWDETQDRDLLAYYQRLVALRRQTEGVWSLPRQTLLTDDVHGTYAYRCGSYCVVLNNRGRTIRTPLDWAGQTELVFTTDASVSLQAGILKLPPFAGAVCINSSG